MTTTHRSKTTFHRLSIATAFLSFIFSHGPVPAHAQSHAANALTIETRQHGQQVEFYVTNDRAYDITTDIDVGGENMSASRRSPLTITIPGNTSRRVLMIEPQDPAQAWGFRYEFQWTRGSLKARHDSNHVYRLPYEDGKGFRVVQGFGGETSHKKDSKYAIDFGMPVGTPILAARAGEVVGVYERSNRGGPTRRFAHLGNHVLVRHADRTLGEYLHLRQWGAEVQVGDSVAAGDLIGYSGNTGYSTGPHLHFGVYSAKNGGTRLSHPVKLQQIGRAHV